MTAQVGSMADANAGGGVAQYALAFVNNSGDSGSACVYQQDPEIGVPDAAPLAWLAGFAYPTTTLVFTWNASYNFVWAERSDLSSEARLVSSQCWRADLTTSNQITLSYARAYTFGDLTTGPGPGSLYVTGDGTVPLRQASVGIGMSGFGTFLAPAQPNLTLKFTPRPQYWIAFGDYRQGDVLNPAEMSNSAQIEFPPNVYSMTATLDQANRWSVGPATV